MCHLPNSSAIFEFEVVACLPQAETFTFEVWFMPNGTLRDRSWRYAYS
ncbi:MULTISPECIES: hypothetical protein [Aerosakkonema]